LGVIKADEDEQVETLTDEELSDVFHAVSSSLSSSVWCVLNVPGQLHEKVLKQATNEKRRAEMKPEYLQDDLRYALKRLLEPPDFNLPYEVRIYPRLVVNSSDCRQGSTALRTSEYEALEDEEART